MGTIPPGEHLSPFEAQRRIHELFAQETRHHVIQSILGHPAKLVSLSELSYYSQKSESAVLDQLSELSEQGLVRTYELTESQTRRDLPGTFYGFTGRGVLLLERFDYLRGIPMLEAIHENTTKTEQIRRHEAAPRPSLPDAVASALGCGSDGSDPGTGHREKAVLAALLGEALPEDGSVSIRDLF